MQLEGQVSSSDVFILKYVLNFDLKMFVRKFESEMNEERERAEEAGMNQNTLFIMSIIKFIKFISFYLMLKEINQIILLIFFFFTPHDQMLP